MQVFVSAFKSGTMEYITFWGGNIMSTAKVPRQMNGEWIVGQIIDIMTLQDCTVLGPHTLLYIVDPATEWAGYTGCSEESVTSNTVLAMP